MFLENRKICDVALHFDTYIHFIYYILCAMIIRLHHTYVDSGRIKLKYIQLSEKSKLNVFLLN